MDINTYNFLMVLIDKIYDLGCGLAFLLSVYNLILLNKENKENEDNDKDASDFLSDIIYIGLMTALSWSSVLFYYFKKREK